MTARQARRKNSVICLAGMTAWGKSTVARRLAQKYWLKYVSGGTVLKELALRLDTNRRKEAGGKQPRCRPTIRKAG